MQRKSYYFNTDRQIVQALIYRGQRRLFRRIASFVEAGVAPDGTLLPDYPAAERAALLLARARAAHAALEAKPPAAPKGLRMRELLQEWQDALAPVRSPRTLAVFVRASNEYIAACGNHPIGAFGLRQYDKFVAALSQPRTQARRPLRPPYLLSVAAKNIRLKALGAFFTWAAERDLVPRRPKIALLRDHKRLPRVPTAAQMDALFAALWRGATTAHRGHRRDYQLQLRLYMLARFTGARLQEMYWLPWAQVDFAEGEIRVLKQGRFAIKERREKVLPMPAVLQAFLTRERAAAPAEVWLFDNGRGELAYASPYGLTHAFRRRWADIGGALAGIKPVHAFRAFFAQELWGRGLDLSIVQQWMGHQSQAITAGYLSDPHRRLRDEAARIQAPALLTAAVNRIDGNQ